MASAKVEGDAATQFYTAYVARCGEQSVDRRSGGVGGRGSRERHRGRDNYKVVWYGCACPMKTSNLNSAAVVRVEPDDNARNFALHGQESSQRT
jgi:hypothetical protein